MSIVNKEKAVITKSAFVSILICSKDRRDNLEQLVSALLVMKTDYAFEIVVVEETDIPKLMERVLYIAHPVKNLGIAYARNLALSHAKGEIIVFIDDDCTFHNNWLNNLLQPFKDKSVLGVQGGVIVPERTNFIGWAESILGFPGGGIKRVITAKGKPRISKEISTLNCAYRKQIVDKVGGFDETLKFGGEDYIFAKQVSAHGICLFIPSSAVDHTPRGSFKKIWFWFVRRGKAEIKVAQSRKYKNADYKSLIRGSLGIKLTLLILACFFTPIFTVYLLGIIIFLYGFVIYARNYKIWKSSRSSIFAFVILPVVKSIMDLATDCGRLMAFIYK